MRTVAAAVTACRRVLPAALLAITQLICATGHAAQTSASPRHALWSLKGKSNTVYLLGSVHFLSASEKLPAVVDEAYADAEALIMEIDMDDLDQAQAQQITLELGVLPPGRSLEQEVGAQTYAQIAAKAREIGVEPQLLNRFRPWLAAMTLVQLHLMKMGLDPNSGVEHRLTARAVSDHKPIRGLETLRHQLELLAGLAGKQQREFLLYSVEDSERATREIDQLLAAWRSGDSEKLEQLMAEGFEEYPDLYRPLTTDRNRQWLPAIEDLLDDADDYLVVVGTLHLVGKNSVIDLLERKGHKVRQH
jgi:uncharacterized protein YbaP (TraB family)